jgi:hypothetical protein
MSDDLADALEGDLADALEDDLAYLDVEKVSAWIESHGWTRHPTASEATLRAWARPLGAPASIREVVSLSLSRQDDWYGRMMALAIGRVASISGIGLVQALRELGVVT